jgi:hypothetical protein
VLPAAAIYDAVACPFVLYVAAAALRLAGTRTPLGARGEGKTQRAAPKREPQLKLGHGWLTGGGLGTAFAATSSLGGPIKVRFAGRRREGVLGGSLLGGSPRGGSLSGGNLARTRMGRSLLGGSVFNRPSPALARTAFSRRAAPLGRSLTPRFSRGKAVSRLAGSMRRSARPRSPGRGWLRGASPRSGALGRADLRATGAGVGRRAFGRGTFRSRSFRSGAVGGSSLGRGSLTGQSWRRRTPRLRSGGTARLRLPRRNHGGHR